MIAAGFAERLEAGWPSALGRLAASLWTSASDPARLLALPAGAAVIGIGGATLGGSGKTPVTLALGRAISETAGPGSVAVVAHGYRARAGAPRVVQPRDPVEAVGDDALLLARGLAGVGCPVVVARRRSEALALAAKLAPRVLVDGLLQACPRRVALSILVLDAERPWGAGRCPPAGDLRAAQARLVAAADTSLRVGALDARPSHELAFAEACSRGAWSAGGALAAWDTLRGSRLGLLLGIAHPERVAAMLGRAGIVPRWVARLPDHAPAEAFVAAARRAPALDAFLVTGKCATKLEPALSGRPVLALDHHVGLPSSLVEMALSARPH